MFNGYNEAPLIYNDFEHERVRKQQNVGKWPYGHGTGIQAHPSNQSEFWSAKGPFLKFPNVLSISSKCGCAGCYPSTGENQGVQGDAARHRPWFHRPVTVPSNGSEDPSKTVGTHHWENVNLPQEKSYSVGETANAGLPQYLQENGEKSSFHRPYVGVRHSEPHQPGVITSAKSGETSRKEESTKRPEEIITSPSGQEILLLGQNGTRQPGSFSDPVYPGKKDSDSGTDLSGFHDRKEKYFNPDGLRQANNSASCSLDQNALLHSAVEPYGKTVPFNPNQNRVPSIGHATFKDTVSESYLDQAFYDPGKSIRSNHQGQSYVEDKNCRNPFQTADSKAAESKMEPVQNGHSKHLPSVYGNYLDYSNYGLKRDLPIPCNPVGAPESQKLQYYGNKKSEYLARNFFPEAARKTGSSLYEESKRDCMMNANSVIGIHEQYLGALGRSNHPVPKYWEAGNPKVSSCGIYYPKDSDKRSRGESKYAGNEGGVRETQRNDPGSKREVANSSLPRVPPHPSIYSSDPAELRYPEKEYAHPFHYQTNSSAYKNLRRPDYPYARYNHQTHYEYPQGANAFQMPELGNPNQYNLKAYQTSAGCPGIEQYLPHLGGAGVFDVSSQQINSASKQYPHSFYDPNFQPVLHSARTDAQTQQMLTSEPGADRRSEIHASRKSGYLETVRSGTTKISPLRLLRKKKLTDPKSEPEKGIVEPGVRNSSSDEGAPALDVRRFWATWAEEEDDNPPTTQMVVLDCQDIDPEQAELLRLYDPEPIRTVQVDGDDILTLKNSADEQKLQLAGEKGSAGKPADARIASGHTVDSFVTSDPLETEDKENPSAIEDEKSCPRPEKESERVSLEESGDPGKTSPHSKSSKKGSSKANSKLSAPEEVMDKWTEKKFDFLKRAEESKAAEMARNEQEKKKILDSKKLCSHIGLGNKWKATNIESVKDSDEISCETSDKDDKKDSDTCSKIGNRLEQNKSPEAKTGKSFEDLPTSEYRKNKFLDYSGSDVLLRRNRENSEPAAKDLSEKAFATKEEGAIARIEPAVRPKETEPVPQEEMDEILEKISRINFDDFIDKKEQNSLDARNSAKNERTKKPRKTGKKFKKTSFQETETGGGDPLSKPKIKFSIQKLQDLKISFKILNDGSNKEESNVNREKISRPGKPETEESSDSGKPVSESGKDSEKSERRSKKRKIRPKTPVVKIKKLPAPELGNVENEDRILDLSKREGNSGRDFRVHEILESAKIKLTFKRDKILSDQVESFKIKGPEPTEKTRYQKELSDLSEREGSSDIGGNLLPCLSENASVPSRTADEETDPISLATEQSSLRRIPNVAERNNEEENLAAGETRLEKNETDSCIKKVDPCDKNSFCDSNVREKRKTVIRHSLDENVTRGTGENRSKTTQVEEIEKRDSESITDDLIAKPRKVIEEVPLESGKTESDTKSVENKIDGRDFSDSSSRGIDRKTRADRDSIETRLSEMFGQDPCNEESEKTVRFLTDEPEVTFAESQENEDEKVISSLFLENEPIVKEAETVAGLIEDRDAAEDSVDPGKDLPNSNESQGNNGGSFSHEENERDVFCRATEPGDNDLKELKAENAKEDKAKPTEQSEEMETHEQEDCKISSVMMREVSELEAISEKLESPKTEILVDSPEVSNLKAFVDENPKESVPEEEKEMRKSISKKETISKSAPEIFDPDSNKKILKRGRSQSLSADSGDFRRYAKSKSLPPETKFELKTDPVEIDFIDIPVYEIPLPDGDPPEGNVFDFREFLFKNLTKTVTVISCENGKETCRELPEEAAPTELKLEMSIKILDEDDDALRFPLPSPTLSEESSRSVFSGPENCASPFVLSGFHKFRNPSPPCEEENFRESKHPRVDSTRKEINLRNPSPPPPPSDSPLSVISKPESEEFFDLEESSDELESKMDISSPVSLPRSPEKLCPETEKTVSGSEERPEESVGASKFRDDRIRTPSPLRPENKFVYGTDCTLSKESIEEGTCEEREDPVQEKTGNETKDPKSFQQDLFRTGEAEGEENVSVIFEDAIFVTDEFFECEREVSDSLPAVDEMEEEKVTDDKFHDVMQNCLENAKKFLSVGHLKLLSCSVEDLLEMEPANQDSEDRISRDVLLTSCEEPTVRESALEENLPSSELSTDFSVSFGTEPADRDLCPEFLPVDNWPYLEEEVPMSPAKSKTDGSEISSPPLENEPSSDKPVSLFDPLKSLPDSRNVIPAYLNDKKIYFEKPLLGYREEIQSRATEEELDEDRPENGGRNGLRRRSLVAESPSCPTFSVLSVPRRKTVDGIASRKSSETNESEDSSDLSKRKNHLKCRLSLERLSLKKKTVSKESNQRKIRDGRKEPAKGEQTSKLCQTIKCLDSPKVIDNGYLSRKWQPHVVLSRISDKELKEKRKTRSTVKRKSLPNVNAFSGTEAQKKVDKFCVETGTGNLNETKNDKNFTLETDTGKPQLNKVFSPQKPPEKVFCLENGHIETEEKIRKKPRFRNLHSKRKRPSGEKDSLIRKPESLTDSETETDPDPDEAKPLKSPEVPVSGDANDKTGKRSTPSTENSKRKRRDRTPEKLELKKPDIRPERKEDKKTKNKPDAKKCCSAENPLQGSENSQRKKDFPLPGKDETDKENQDHRSETDKSNDAVQHKNGQKERKRKRKAEETEEISCSSWICQVCGFSDQAQRSLHIKTHAFHCQSCHLAFKTEICFTEHLTQKHKDIRNQHHCLLCELSFDEESDHRKHLESREHKHLESVEKNTINTLFTLLTGQPCPVLGPVEIRPEWLPSQAGTVHFYHQATPLSLALQYLKMRHDSSSLQPK